MMLTFVIWIFLCVAAGLFARIRRNRSGAGWFCLTVAGSLLLAFVLFTSTGIIPLAFFVVPLAAFVVLAILQPLALPDPALIELQVKPSIDEQLRPTTGGAIVMVLAVAAVIFVVIMSVAKAQQTVIRDAQGRTIGTAAQSGNQTTFRDSAGRSIGTGTIDSTGTTVFRDAGGRSVGTVQSPHVVDRPQRQQR